MLILTANAGFCEVSRRVVLSSIAVKFGLAMAGVVISSVIIYAGLSIYNKFFVDKKISKTYEEEILKTPKTTDEAVRFFIKKNKLD